LSEALWDGRGKRFVARVLRRRATFGETTAGKYRSEDGEVRSTG
jgi:hypothetical protein